MNSNVKLIEDYLCNLCDLVFNDGIICDKMYNPEQLVNRSAYITDIQSIDGDQHALVKCNARIAENRKNRPECVTDTQKIIENFNKSGASLGNGLAIYIEIEYITMPIKIIVNTQTAFTVSANLKITAK